MSSQKKIAKTNTIKEKQNVFNCAKIAIQFVKHKINLFLQLKLCLILNNKCLKKVVKINFSLQTLQNIKMPNHNQAKREKKCNLFI